MNRSHLLTLFLSAFCVVSGGRAATLEVVTQNTLRLSQRASDFKLNFFRDQSKEFDVNLYQEVMSSADLADIMPGAYTFQDSPLQGHSTYRERYSLIFKNTLTPVNTDNDTEDYPDNNNDFSRPPCGTLLKDGSGTKIWFIDYHAVFGKSASVREAEIEEMGAVYNWFKTGTTYGTVNRVVIGGDWNMDADDDSFDNLKAIGKMKIKPNDESSLTKWGDPSQPYDHIAADQNYVVLSDCGLVNLPTDMNDQEYRDNISDHRAVACTLTY